LEVGGKKGIEEARRSRVWGRCWGEVGREDWGVRGVELEGEGWRVGGGREKTRSGLWAWGGRGGGKMMPTGSYMKKLLPEVSRSGRHDPGRESLFFKKSSKGEVGCEKRKNLVGKENRERFSRVSGRGNPNRAGPQVMGDNEGRNTHCSSKGSRANLPQREG